MKALDADGDGTLSANEIQNATAALKAIDKDGDGVLSGQELRPDRDMIEQMRAMRGGEGRRGGEGMRGNRPGMRREGGRRGPGGNGRNPSARLFERADKNGDGELSKDEVPGWIAERMDALDTDGNGSLSKQEMAKGMANRRGRGRPVPEKEWEARIAGARLTPSRHPISFTPAPLASRLSPLASPAAIPSSTCPRRRVW